MLDGNPWFVAADVCSVLDLSNTSIAVSRLDPADKRKSSLGLRGRDPLIISESGLYKLVMRSDKQEAKAFQDWVTREVLPSIRKNGGYIAGQEKVATGEMSPEEPGTGQDIEINR